MQLPHIKNELYNPTTKVKYEVMAYRSLTRSELIQSAMYYHSNCKKKSKLKPGTVITIMTVIGCNE
jgi:hypothetical protein